MGIEDCQEDFEEEGWEEGAVWGTHSSMGCWQEGKDRRGGGPPKCGRQVLGPDAKPGTYGSVVTDTLYVEQFVLSLLFLGQVLSAHLLKERHRIYEPSQGLVHSNTHPCAMPVQR